MFFVYLVRGGILVAPLVGAWIEIRDWGQKNRAQWSLLSWERGLKYLDV